MKYVTLRHLNGIYITLCLINFSTSNIFEVITQTTILSLNILIRHIDVTFVALHIINGTTSQRFDAITIAVKGQ